MPSAKSDARVVFLLAVAVFGSAVFAQEAPRFSESIDVSLVNVEVIVTDRNGERVRGLKASDFTILEDRKSQEIVNFAEYAGERGTLAVGVENPAARADRNSVPRQPRTIIVFVDELALAASPTDIRPALRETLRTALEPGDVGAVLGWTRSLKMRQGFTGDVDALTRAIDALPARGAVFSEALWRQEMRESDAFWRAAMNDPRNARCAPSSRSPRPRTPPASRSTASIPRGCRRRSTARITAGCRRRSTARRTASSSPPATAPSACAITSC